nr:MAG: hypothetical protein [Caudoviricetes sp.]
MKVGKQMFELNEKELIQEAIREIDQDNRERKEEQERILQSFRDFARNLSK